ncbi:uncharacterized protein LOC105698009 isoform X2 [Orussus abietinus]|uniref:uncharacterized protein LOC105698009 isoform X2 n=1 Tax=Orussus abietinus TaxID=222816 RepID=UPI000624FF35|nr:uncharacterized protein LOC105698009 isoform X2 [Orussus abietinus]
MNIQDNVNRNKHATTQGEADFNYSDKQDIQTVSDEAVSAKENVIEHRQADKRMKDIVREMAADAVEPAKQVLSPILEETKVSNESSAAKHPKITNVETVHYNLKKVHTVVPGSPLENGSFIDQFRINSELEISNLSVLYDQAMTNRRGFPLSPGGGSVNEESMIGLQYPSARHCVSPAASEHQSDNGGNYKDPAQKTENNFPAANSEFTFTMFGQRGTGGGDNFF